MALYLLKNDISELKNDKGNFIECIVYDAGQPSKVEFHLIDGFFHWYKDEKFVKELTVYEMLMTIELSYTTNSYRDKSTGKIILENWRW